MRKSNETARRILYHARLYLVKRCDGFLSAADGDAVALLFNIEMGLAYNASMPGRGI